MHLGVCGMGKTEEHGADLLRLVMDHLGSPLTVLVLLEHHSPVGPCRGQRDITLKRFLVSFLFSHGESLHGNGSTEFSLLSQCQHVLVQDFLLGLHDDVRMVSVRQE